jgi:hypothetical protein
MTNKKSGDARLPPSSQVEDTQEELVWDILGELVRPEAADRMICSPRKPTLSTHHIVLKTVSWSSWDSAKDQMLE